MIVSRRRRAAADNREPVRIDRILPLVCFIAALPPRLWRLDSRPFWCDELITLQRASLPMRSLIGDALAHHHTPLYFILAAPFAHAPDPQFWLRFPSAIFSAVGVMLVYLIAARIAGRNAGIAAALIIGLAPVEIAYAQEARSYMLQMCLILLALHGLLGLVLAGESAALSWRDARAPRADWVNFIGGTTLALCTLGDSLPWLLAANGSAAMLIWRAANKAGMSRNFLLANAGIVVFCLPLYLCMLHLLRRDPLQGIGYVPAPAPLLIWNEVQSVYLMRICDFMTFSGMAVPTPRLLSWSIGGGLAAAGAAGLWRLSARPPLLLTLLLALLVLPVSFGIVSIWLPLLIPRYLLWSGAIFAVLAGVGAAAGAARLGPTARTLAGGAFSLLLLVNLAPFYDVETKPRWDIAAQILAAQAWPGDVVLISQPISAPVLRYYLPFRLQPISIAGWNGDCRDIVQAGALAEAHGHRVWAIFAGGAHTAEAGSAPEFYASLAPLGRPAATERAGTRITLWRFGSQVPARRQARQTSL